MHTKYVVQCNSHNLEHGITWECQHITFEGTDRHYLSDQSTLLYAGLNTFQALYYCYDQRVVANSTDHLHVRGFTSKHGLTSWDRFTWDI